jgi:GntR family transcriptional repressor for pyruvate dehydrogenase complex
MGELNMEVIQTMFHAAHKTQKISCYVVEQIRDAILTGRFKPGDRLASERELIDQFQISKASIREALRVLEAMGLVEIRKGVGGGIFVAEVDMQTTVHSVMNFLHFKHVSTRDITMLRYLLEPPLAQVAALKSNEEDIRKLQTMTDEEMTGSLHEDAAKGIGFHRYIARFSQNPLLILLMDFIENLLADSKAKLKPGKDFHEAVAGAHHEILDAFVRKDALGAGRAMTEHVLEVGVGLAQLEGVEPFEPAMIGAASGGNGHMVGNGCSANLNLKDISHLLPHFPSENERLVLSHVGTGELYLFEMKDGLMRKEDGE